MRTFFQTFTRWCVVTISRAGGVAALALAVAASCGKPAPVVEAGALLLSISAPPGVIVDELRLWIYDDGGVLFDGRRVPDSGALPRPKSDGDLGTVLVQPGAARGDLRIHARGLAAGVRLLEGVARVDLARVKDGRVDLALFALAPADDDADGVPDDIDDCPAEANPSQGGCPSGDGGAAPGGSGGGAGSAGLGGGGGAGGAAGGATAMGGMSATGGRAATGGAGGSGGRTASGGAPGSGGAMPGAGGVMGSGGTGGAGWPWDAGLSWDAGVPGDGAMPSDALRDSAPMEMPRKSLGVTCTGASECASGFCVDGLCCESACNRACEACRAGGRCQDVVRAQDVPQCAGTMTCNARAMCVND